MGVLEITGVAIAAFNKLMDKIPNYDQRKRDDFLEMKRDYEFEVKSEYPDCARIDDLRIRIMHHIGSELGSIN